jgi:hypothetical protein
MIVLFTLSLSAQKTTEKQLAMNTSNAGVFAFENEIINYGTINQNTDGNRVFKFKNTGNQPIIISKIKSSCGCTVASKPSKPIMPGETSEINIKYDTKRIGAFSKTITITSNANQPIKQLKIKGKIIKEELVSSK